MHAAHAIAPALLAAATLWTASADLTPRRDAGTALRIDTETLIELETVSATTEIDGEVREGRGVGSHTLEARRAVHVDRCVAEENGRPTEVRRAFERLTLESSIAFGGFDTAGERRSPLEGVTLRLRHDGARPSVTVDAGAEPDAELLESHRLGLALCALLPAKTVEVGESWKLDAAALRRAFEVDLQGAYFPPSPDEDGRARWSSGMHTSLDELLDAGGWTGTATLERAGAVLGGRPCAAVRVRLEGEGALLADGSDGAGRDATPPSAALATAFEAEIDGTLWFSTELGVPLGIELEGEIAIDSERTGERDGTEWTTRSRREGNVSHRVTIVPVEANGD